MASAGRDYSKRPLVRRQRPPIAAVGERGTHESEEVGDGDAFVENLRVGRIAAAMIGRGNSDLRPREASKISSR